MIGARACKTNQVIWRYAWVGSQLYWYRAVGENLLVRTGSDRIFSLCSFSQIENSGHGICVLCWCNAAPRFRVRPCGGTNKKRLDKRINLIQLIYHYISYTRFVSTVWQLYRRYMAGSKTEIDRILGCTGCTGCDVF